MSNEWESAPIVGDASTATAEWSRAPIVPPTKPAWSAAPIVSQPAAEPAWKSAPIVGAAKTSEAWTPPAIDGKAFDAAYAAQQQTNAIANPPSRNPIRAAVQHVKESFAAPVGIVDPNILTQYQREQNAEHPVAPTLPNKIGGIIGGAGAGLAEFATLGPVGMAAHAGLAGAGEQRVKTREQRAEGQQVSGMKEAAQAVGAGAVDAAGAYASAKMLGGRAGRGIVENIGAMGGIAGTQKLAHNVIEGQPTTEGVKEATVEGAATQGIMHGVMAGAEHLAGRFAPEAIRERPVEATAPPTVESWKDAPIVEPASEASDLAPAPPSPPAESAALAQKLKSPRQPKGIARTDIERELLNIGEQHGAYGESQTSEATAGEHGVISQANLTFHQKLPEEVTTFLEGRPAAKRLFRVTDDPGQAHGEDAMAQMGDAYFDRIDQIAGSKLKASVEAARKSPDPRHQMLAAIHDRINQLDAPRPLQEKLDPATLKDGMEFTMFGHKIEVREDADGLKILQDGDEFPVVPADAVGELPVDKGSLREGERPKFDPGEDFFAPDEVRQAMVETGADPNHVDKLLANRQAEAQNVVDATSQGPQHRDDTSQRQGDDAGRNAVAAGAEGRAASGKQEQSNPQKVNLFADEKPPASPVVDENFGPPPGSTSARKAQMAQDREALGLTALDSPERRGWQQALDTAQSQGIPDKATRLAAEVNATPRALSDIETAGMVVHATKLKNEHSALMEEISKAKDPADIRTKAAEAGRIEEEFDSLSQALKSSGTEKGRALASQKLTLNKDYQLISVLSRAKAAKGAELTPAERTRIEALTEQLQKHEARVADLEKQMTEKTAAHEAATREFEAKLAHAKLKAEAKQRQSAPARYGARNKIVTIDAYQKALAELRDTSTTHAGIPVEKFAAAVKVAAYHIEAGARTFADFATNMTADLGKKIEDDEMKALYAKAQEAVGASTKKRIIDTIKEKQGKGGEPMGRAVQALAKQFVREGITEREPLIDAVHAELKNIDPKITREQTMDAISGYGDYKTLSKDEIDVKLRDLKGQMQQLGKLRDLEAKMPPQKTGVERRTPSLQERELTKQVNDLRRKLGIQTTDPETQLKSTLDGIKTRLKNEIEELDAHITSGEKIVREKSTVPYDAEAKSLKEQRDVKRQQYDEIFGKTGLTDAQRIAIAGKSLDRSIATLEADLKAGKIYPDAKNKPLTDPTLEAKRVKLNELRSQRDELRTLDAPRHEAEKANRLTESIAELSRRIAAKDIAPRQNAQITADTEPVAKLRAQREALQQQLKELRTGPKLSPIEARRKQLMESIQELNQRIAKGDYSKRAKPEPLRSPDLDRLAYQRDLLRRQINQRIQAMKPKTIWGRATGLVTEPLNIARSLMTSFDLSAVLRQGGFIAIGNPARAARSFVPMLRAFASDQASHTINTEILNRPNAPLYARSKLFLSRSGEGAAMSAQEEMFMSRLAGKIPGIKASERAYTTFLNKLRADSFDAMTATLARNGEPTQPEASAIANFINVATGRGSLGSAQSAANNLNSVFFAPRYLASRFQLLGQPLTGFRFGGGSPRTRGLIAKEYAKYAIGMGIVYSLGAAAGGSMEKDPRSSDFGKMKFGNTRIDPLSGLSQVIRYTTQTATAQQKQDGRIVKADRLKTPLRFARSKLSPGAGALVDVLDGKDFTGQPVTWQNTLSKLFFPLAIGDVKNAIEDQGVPKGVALSLLGLLGMGLQTYSKKKRTLSHHPAG